MKNLRDFAESLSHTDLRQDMVKKFTDVGYFAIDPGMITEDDWYDKRRWIVENISTDHAAVCDGHFIFEFEQDVTLYKLKWGS